MISRGIIIRLFLAIALLFAQQGSLVHGLAHTELAQPADQSLPHDKHCDLCAVYAQIGSAIGSSDFSFAGSDHFETLHVNRPASDTSRTFAAFAARAPPYPA